MRIILFTQYYRARTPERQAELDHCLSTNLQHPVLDQVVVLREPDAPSLPGPARMDVQEVDHAERVTYSHWIQRLMQETNAIGILINSDIALGTGWEQLYQVLNTPESVVALSRYNYQGRGKPAQLNKCTHWTQDTWALRSDAPISESLLCSSSLPIGYPGCDNRIAYVLWSHGFAVKNPCFHLETVHCQADENRSYDKNKDRLYGGASYVHPSLSLAEPSELEHAIWTKARDACSGLLVNQQAVGLGVHQLLAKEEVHKKLFLEQQKSAGLAWSFPPLDTASSAHATSFNMQQLLSDDGCVLSLNAHRCLKGLQLRLPRHLGGRWLLSLQALLQTSGSWQPLELGAAAEFSNDGQRHFIELPVQPDRWQQLRMHLHRQTESHEPVDGVMELLTFAEKEETPPLEKLDQPAQAVIMATSVSKHTRPLNLNFVDRRIESSKMIIGQDWQELYRYSNRFVVQQRDGRIVFLDRYWPTAISYRDPKLEQWSNEDLREAFLWGFAGPVLEWTEKQYSVEKMYQQQLHFWQYPCRTEQDAFERHCQMLSPFWDAKGVHVYVGMPWATWIDKKTFPEQLLNAYCSRFMGMSAILQESLHVHSVCQHIRWKEHLHRFEQAGINHLWIAHKEVGWDRERNLELHSWPLYAVNVLDPERREGLKLLPIEQKTIFASFKGAHMKHYPSDIRLRLKALAHLDGYEIEVSDLWHFNRVVYNFQVLNNNKDRDAIEKQEVVAYNQLLSNSSFSLCPCGAGPNTLRLWESLGVGAIPVVLSDHHEFPSLESVGHGKDSWSKGVIHWPEAEISELDKFIRAISTKEKEGLQSEGLRLFALSREIKCFG